MTPMRASSVKYFECRSLKGGVTHGDANDARPGLSSLSLSLSLSLTGRRPGGPTVGVIDRSQAARQTTEAAAPVKKIRSTVE